MSVGPIREMERTESGKRTPSSRVRQAPAWCPTRWNVLSPNEEKTEARMLQYQGVLNGSSGDEDGMKEEPNPGRSGANVG